MAARHLKCGVSALAEKQWKSALRKNPLTLYMVICVMGGREEGYVVSNYLECK